MADVDLTLWIKNNYYKSGDFSFFFSLGYANEA